MQTAKFYILMATLTRSPFCARPRNRFKRCPSSSAAARNISTSRKARLLFHALRTKPRKFILTRLPRCKPKSESTKAICNAVRTCLATPQSYAGSFNTTKSPRPISTIVRANIPPCSLTQKCADCLWRLISQTIIPFKKIFSRLSRKCAALKKKKWSSALTVAPRQTLPCRCTTPLSE